jgi:hypothetical protein
MTFIRNLTLRNGLALVALFIALGGTATATTRRLIGHKDIKRGAVTALQVKDHSLKRHDFIRGQVPRGRRGRRGATGAPGARGPAGGAAGATGARGPAGAAGAPGAFAVEDANGRTAGPLLGISGTSLTFDFHGHAISADSFTGLVSRAGFLYYTSDDCTGPPLENAYASQAAFRSTDPADDTVYTQGPPVQTTAHSRTSQDPGCQTGLPVRLFTGSYSPLRALSAADTPPPLAGPLRYVPAT